MAILDTIKKGYCYMKTSTGYIKLLPRTLAELVSLKNGLTVEYVLSKLKNAANATLVNNATTTVENTALDGRMGKTLQDQITTLNSKIEYQLTPIWSNPTYNITKLGNVIYIDYYCLVNDGRGGNAYGIAKLPSEICPKHTIKTQAWTASTNSQRHGASVEIKPDGKMLFVAGDSFIEAGFTVSYPL